MTEKLTRYIAEVLRDTDGLVASRAIGEEGMHGWEVLQPVDVYLAADVDAQLAASPATAWEPPWQSIETAPLSDDDVLVIDRNGDCHVAWHGTGYWLAEHGPVEPTHWRPLPPSPETT